MNCKYCRKPVERSIEGELICSNCWSEQQMTPEDKADAKEQAWFQTHCAACEKPTRSATLERTGGFCVVCDKENQEMLEEIFA